MSNDERLIELHGENMLKDWKIVGVPKMHGRGHIGQPTKRWINVIV